MEPRRILCPIDFSPLSERSLRLAVEVCRRLGAQLVIEHNVGCPPPAGLAVGWMWGEEHETAEEDKSSQAVSRLEQVFTHIPEDVEYEAMISHGPLDEGILYLAKSLPADMIVMGTHGPSDASHQSLTESIIIRAPCPVLTTGETYAPETVFGVEGGPKPDEMSFLIPFDFSKHSRTALSYGLTTARRMPHRIHLLHVAEGAHHHGAAPVGSDATEKILSRLKDFVPADLEDRMETKVVIGDPVQCIVEEAERTRALFVLLAAHGKGAFKRLLFGSRTLGILHGCQCPVWFLPPATLRGFETREG